MKLLWHKFWCRYHVRMAFNRRNDPLAQAYRENHWRKAMVHSAAVAKIKAVSP